MNRGLLLVLIFLAGFMIRCSPEPEANIPNPAVINSWPTEMPWWKANNLRLIQTNLPAYEATLNVDSLLADIMSMSANVLLINAGGIMAFYPSKLDFHYINPYMQDDMLEKVIRKCHDQGIRVIVRFDFSRVHESIFEAHPDWCYISPSGERMINDDMYLVSINAPYLQEKSIEIVEEVIDNYPIDGLFINMPGYHTRNHYEGTYHGVDQNRYDRLRFAEFSGGMDLPEQENAGDPVFRRYQEFKQFTVADWLKNLHAMVKSKSDQIAICTYRTSYVDIIRHESQTRELPHWPYNSSDNVNNLVNSYPDHIASNASIQQISFQSRYNAVEPEEVAIRLYENIAHGSGLDISLMGDFRGYEDPRNIPIVRQVYGFHKKYEPYFGRYSSLSEVAVISPGYWPGGDAMREYRGIQLMLNEAHIPYDIIEDSQLHHLRQKLEQYRVIILPEITELDQQSIEVLNHLVFNGTSLVATNKTLTGNPGALRDLFGAVPDSTEFEGSGNYLVPDDYSIFKRLPGQTMLFWKFNLGLYRFPEASQTHLPILSKGRPGPPEKIGGHEETGYFALGFKDHQGVKNAIIPANLGKLYYLYGYEQHKNILLDILEYLYPETSQLVQTNAHPRVETVLRKFKLNLPENYQKTHDDGMILHLINLTGFSGNTYFEPLTQKGLTFKIPSDFEPDRIFSLVGEKELQFDWKDGFVNFTVDELRQYDGIVIEKVSP